MKKLIKLSDTHYIIVDDTEIKEGDIFIHPDKTIERASRDLDGRGLNKITHSTQPLELSTSHINTGKYHFDKIKYLSLSEVEEVINGYSVEKMAESKYPYKLSSNARKKGFIEGFKTHQELVKDKLFTIEDLEKALSQAFLACQDGYDITTKEIIQSLLPKTEWDIEIDKNNKITLL